MNTLPAIKERSKRRSLGACRAKETGFTLVELLIAMAVSAIVLLAVISLFWYQQRAYVQQADLARGQAQVRASLHLLARDIRMAGYTGIALGMDLQNEQDKRVNLGLAKDQLFPIRAWEGTTLADGTTLLNSPRYGQSEAIEVWGNFLRKTTTAADPYFAGATGIKIRDHQLLMDNYVNLILIGMAEQISFHRITGVTAGNTTTPWTFTIDPPLAVPMPAEATVAPIQRRIFFVTPVAKKFGALTETVGTLYRRTYVADPTKDLSARYSNTCCTCYIDEEIADRIDYLDFRYSLAELDPVASLTLPTGKVTGKLDNSPDISGSDNNNPPNPCAIRSVTLHLISDTPVPLTAQGKRTGTPLSLDYAQDITPRNLGLYNHICSYANYDASISKYPDPESPCALEGTTIGL